MARTSSARGSSGGLAGGSGFAGPSRARAAGPGSPSGCGYVVARRLDRWRVTYEKTTIGAFDDLADATRFACDVARMEAQAGVSTSVEVQAAILERHYFVSVGPGAASPPGTR